MGSAAVLRVGNASGFYGDRFSAVQEMLTGGPLDVLTGDYLAELTMLILARDRIKDPATGYAKTFLRQMEECLGLALERGVRIVVNAGGLAPARLAEALRELAGRQGLDPAVAHVEGDDLLPRRAELGLPEGLLAANAYLGAFGVAECLKAGADVVVTGRVTDAALVAGPAIAHFGWAADELDALAGAVVAGHVLECGAQATGGNYAFFREHDVTRPGFPIAELHADGSSVITKHPGTGGAVTTGTVTAQLLYETGGARYLGPDVTARLDSVRLTQEGPDRVQIDGVRGEAPPSTLKVGLNSLGGYRNEVVLVLTGLDIEAKAALVRRQLDEALPPEVRPAGMRWTLARTDHHDADTEEGASALLRLTARDRDPAKVGRELGKAAVELGLSGYPGFHLTAPPGPGSPYGVFTAAYVDAEEVEHTAVLPDGGRIAIAPAPRRVAPPVPAADGPGAPVPAAGLPAPLPPGPARRAPLGLVVGARSGDKGGDANLGVWARDDAGWSWLAHTLGIDLLRRLLPETADLPIERHLLPNLRAVNFTITGLLGEGVAAQHRFDPQAKALGEWLRSRHLDIPEALL
ncbi:acyclic terpene utilization AtuA family protein [Kitasatospora sp. CM 4170]|uniref:Acyclic terpene utilization AtuA family protein n=1 Tax=Kitasatospora aburaviensis TaxID=67265 RepID=A0ABW1F7A8_9ACTN|nr:acyclic terpene utilization AtuA family protein [Kitasatospora sp. CM 4170]WNM44227.1 acyclic terpene utilization AtuA family protein [Kitasatospora sp. CM 4170]